jgi:hypothetical protein
VAWIYYRTAVFFEVRGADTNVRSRCEARPGREHLFVDIEKTIAFLLEQQARFDLRMEEFHQGMEELRRNQQATERLINAFAKAGEAQIELHRARLDSLERRMETDEQRFQAFLDRFDAFLRGQQGDGHGA